MKLPIARWPLTVLRTAAIGTPSPFLCDCGIPPEQRKAILSFSSATVQVADTTADEFVQVRNDTVTLRSRMLELRSDDVRLDKAEADLDGPLNVDELNRRLKAVSALKRYGQLLEQ